MVAIDFFPKTFKGKRFDVRMINIDQMESDNFTQFFDDNNLFTYPEMPELVSVDQCFAVIADKKHIYIGYSEVNIIELSQCLIEFETFVSKNKDVLS